MDFEVKESERYQLFLVDSKARLDFLKEVLSTPDGELYLRYLKEEDTLVRLISNGNGFRGRVANRRERLKCLQKELLPRQYAKIIAELLLRST